MSDTPDLDKAKAEMSEPLTPAERDGLRAIAQKAVEYQAFIHPLGLVARHKLPRLLDERNALETKLEVTKSLMAIEREQWHTECDTLRAQLGNLLAIIHRDGGHRQSDIGTDAAVDEAHQIWAALRARCEQLERENYILKLENK